MQKLKFFTANLIFLSLSFTSPVKAAFDPNLAGYYLGRDTLTALNSGAYIDLANPNVGKSTLLLQHGNHYHGIGAHSYSGTKPAVTITDTNANNRIPEISSLEAPLALTLGSGSLYGDKLIAKRSDSGYSNLSFQFVDALDGKAVGSVEEILFNSSAKRWNTLMKGSELGLQLISATPGLFIGDDKATEILTVGKIIGGDFLNNRFKPVFWVAKNAPIKTYTAEFRVVDLKDASKNGGRFYFDFTNAAEPAAVGENAVYDAKTSIISVQDVVYDGRHFTVTLAQGGADLMLWNLKEVKLLDKQFHKGPFGYNMDTKKFTISNIKAFGQTFRVVLFDTGGFKFKVDSVTAVGEH